MVASQLPVTVFCFSSLSSSPYFVLLCSGLFILQDDFLEVDGVVGSVALENSVLGDLETPEAMRSNLEMSYQSGGEEEKVSSSFLFFLSSLLLFSSPPLLSFIPRPLPLSLNTGYNTGTAAFRLIRRGRV